MLPRLVQRSCSRGLAGRSWGTTWMQTCLIWSSAQPAGSKQGQAAGPIQAAWYRAGPTPAEGTAREARLGIYGSSQGILADVAARQRQQLLGSSSNAARKGNGEVKAGAGASVSIGPAPAAAAAGQQGGAGAAAGSRPGFVPEHGFKGQRKGYVFRAGEQGLGYYLDGAAGAGAKDKPKKGAKAPSHAEGPDKAEAEAADLAGEGDESVMKPLKGALQFALGSILGYAQHACVKTTLCDQVFVHCGGRGMRDAWHARPMFLAYTCK